MLVCVPAVSGSRLYRVGTLTCTGRVRTTSLTLVVRNSDIPVSYLLQVIDQIAVQECTVTTPRGIRAPGWQTIKRGNVHVEDTVCVSECNSR